MSSEEKLRYADYRINTAGTFEETRQDVIAVHTALLRLQGSAQIPKP
jgi:dephospho-CoA kinase